MPLFFFYLAFNSDSALNYHVSDIAKKSIYTLMALITILAPLLSMMTLYYSKMISEFELKNRRERMIPYSITLFYYVLAAYFLFIKASLPIPFYGFLAGVVLSLCITILINTKWKISAHMIGVSGVIGAFWALPDTLGAGNLITVLCLILLAGIIGTARIISGAHSLSQVIAGALVGFVGMYLTIGAVLLL